MERFKSTWNDAAGLKCMAARTNWAGGKKWRAVFLTRTGRNLDDVTRFFPQTMSYIRDCTGIVFPIAGISFSVLEPGAYIAPHSDRTNVFIHFHQSVVVPGDCGLKVGGNDIAFEEQRSYLFDPSFVHEAWNRSSRNRIHLILPVLASRDDRPGTRSADGSVRDASGAQGALRTGAIERRNGQTGVVV